MIKDRQYTASADSHARRSCQSALYHIAEAMTRWMAPILSFTAQEIWQALPGEREEFVFTGQWYNGLQAVSGKFTDEQWQHVLEVRDAVNRVLENARKEDIIGATLQAEVTLYADDTLKATLDALVKSCALCC